jgi:four helix bundle suffix protein
LIKVATCLLDRQSRQLEKAFIEEGGMRERMTRARLDERSRQAAAMSPKSPRGRKA